MHKTCEFQMKPSQGFTILSHEPKLQNMTTNPSKYDVLIIGAGPIGMACGIEAVRRKQSHGIIEKGCLVNSLYHYPINMTFFSTSERLEIGEVPFISHGVKPTRREALEYYRRVKNAWRLNTHTYETVLDIDGQAGSFHINTDKATYQAKAVIIATGYYDCPNLLHVPGEDLPKVKHYYDEPHPYAEQRVAVIGAGNSAVDVALETYRCGAAEVTMIVREPKLKDSIKYWVRPDIDNRLKANEIKAMFNAEVTAIRAHEIDIKTPEGLFTLPNDFVLAMTGYQPKYTFLTQLGIEFSADESRLPQFDPRTHESNRSGLYLAGVVCGGMETSRWFIENSREHAVKIFNHLASVTR